MNLLSLIVLILCAAFLYKTQKNTHQERYISISGKAEKEIIIDTIKWVFTIERKGDKLEKLHKELIGDKENVARFLKENGITEDEIEMTDFASENRKEKMSIIGANIKVKTKNIPAVFQMRTEMGTLYAAGVKVIRNDIEAIYSKFDQETHELTMIAAKNARQKAQEMAEALKVKDVRILSVEVPKTYYQSTRTLHSGFFENKYTTENDKSLLKRRIEATVDIKVAIK